MTKLPEKIVVRVFFIDPLLNALHRPSVDVQGALAGRSPVVVSYHDYTFNCKERKFALRSMADRIYQDGGIYLNGVDGLTTFVPQDAILPMIAGPESSLNETSS